MTSDDANNAYRNLGPDQILHAIESIGYRCDGYLYPLNSYENRVYQIGVEDAPPLIAKFYRPDRWSDAQIEEEHSFTRALTELEIPVVAPVFDEHGRGLHHQDGFRFALYHRAGGYTPNLEDPVHLQQLGRCIARIHAVGERQAFQHRPRLEIDSFVSHPAAYLLKRNFIPGDLIAAYQSLIATLLEKIAHKFQAVGEIRYIRLHGDCHVGNVLWMHDAPVLVDFDDARMGPAVQDFWMLLSGERNEMLNGLREFLIGYSEFFEFDQRELYLVEALRTMRIVHYSGWIAKRWRDPAFPKAFPWFGTQRYWEEHILTLREQLAALDEEPLILG